MAIKLLKIVLLNIALSSVAFAHVALKVDDNIKVTAINGEPIQHSLFQPIKQIFQLAEGWHVITAHYERLFELNKNDHDVLRSKDLTVKANLVGNETYRLIMPNQPDRYQDAKDYIKTPSLAIVQGDEVISQQTMTDPPKTGGLLSGIGAFFGRDLSANQRAIHAIQSAQDSTTNSDEHVTTLDRFMVLWLSANENEREKIRQWVQK